MQACVCSHSRAARQAILLTVCRKQASGALYVRKLLGIPGAPKDNTAFRLKYDTYGDEARKEGG